KTLTPEESDAENVGIARFSAAGALALTEMMDRIVGAGQVRDWLPRAFAEFAAARPLHAVDSRGFPWIEIDFPEDYWRACSEVLPAIDALGGLRAHSHAGARDVAAVASGRAFHHV